MSTEAHDLYDTSWTSDCCGAAAWGPVYEDKNGKTATGICADCKEHCGFTKEEK